MDKALRKNMMYPRLLKMLVFLPFLISTSLTCGKTQGNNMISGDGDCNVDSEIIFYDHSPLSNYNILSLDLNTFSTINAFTCLC
jgi:hypothetical protein